MDDARFDTHQPLPELQQVCSNTDTDSTISNLTGPGRAVDNFYCSAGRLLERFVNVTATKIGKGPLAAARRIRVLRAETFSATNWHVWWCTCWQCRLGFDLRQIHGRIIIRSPSAMRKLKNKLQKECRRLVRYIECVLRFSSILI